MTNNNHICVLLSTYNGEKYLREQIDSILKQEGVKVELLVRDDGSIDSTLLILKEYESKNLLKILNSDKNLGPAPSFMELLYNSPDSDFYAFADQDDIWKPKKLLTAVEMLNNISEPALYCSNQIIYENGIEKSLRFNKEPNYSLVNLICGNSISGCTMVMNYKLKEILNRYKISNDVLRIRMHDVWCLLVASITGKIIYDKDAYIDYRIHNSNTVGLGKKGLMPKLLKLKKKLLCPYLQNGRSKIAKELLKIDSLSMDDAIILKCFASYRNSFIDKINILMNTNIRKNCDEKRFLFMLKVLFNWI